MPDAVRVTGQDYGRNVRKRGQSFRDMKPKEKNLVSDIYRSDDHTDFESNKVLSGGRDLARPLVPGSTGGKAGLGRKGRKGRSR